MGERTTNRRANLTGVAAVAAMALAVGGLVIARALTDSGSERTSLGSSDLAVMELRLAAVATTDAGSVPSAESAPFALAPFAQSQPLVLAQFTNLEPFVLTPLAGPAPLVPTPMGSADADTVAPAGVPATTVRADTDRRPNRRDPDDTQVEVFGAAIPAPPEVASSTTTETVTVEADPWAAVRECEASGNYRANTGNGFYGAYQFSRRTWNWVASAVGRDDLVGVLPSEASTADQDRLAEALAFELAGGGLRHWPICGRHYGV